MSDLTKKQELIKEYIEKQTKKLLKESIEGGTLLDKAKGLDFETEDEYFEYIVDSITNGQPQQAKQLFKDLNSDEQKQFIDWFETSYNYEASDNGELTNKIFRLLSIDEETELDEISLTGLGNITKKGFNKVADTSKKIWDKASDKTDQFVDNTRDKFDKGVEKVKEIGSDIKKEYNKGVASDTEKKLYSQMEKVKQIIINYNETAKKAGIPLINPRKMMGILNTIKMN